VTPSRPRSAAQRPITIDEAVLELDSRSPEQGKGGSQTMDPRLNVITLAVDDLERRSSSIATASVCRRRASSQPTS
jgi:hypothetical protein